MATFPTSVNVYLLIWSVLVIAASGVKNFTRSVCTSPYTLEDGADSGLYLSCPRGGGLIYVLRAFYGRSSSGRCAFTPGDTCLSNALYAPPVIACLGRASCRVPGRPRPLPRCGEDSHYLQVEYQCIADDAHSRFDICGARPPGVAPGSSPSDSPPYSPVPLVREGHIMTTNFPSPYPRGALCDCLITAAISAHTRIELELLDFRLQASPGCQTDFVELLRGEDGGGGGGGGGGVRLCGGIGRWARRTVNSTWARLRLHTDSADEFRGFWIRVWAQTRDNTAVPVTVTCQSHLVPPPSPLPPDGLDQNQPGVTVAPPGVGTTSDGRNIWSGTLPPGHSEGARRLGDKAPTTTTVSKNTGIIIGVCVAGVVTMVIINIVGIIICRRNMQANRSKRAALAAAASGHVANSLDSFSSLDTEYVSLNSNGASYHSNLCDSNLYTTFSKAGRAPVGNQGTVALNAGVGSAPAAGIPTYDTGVVIERTPGVGQSSVKPSDYDYGMLPATYTRKSHTMELTEEDEDPYAVLRDFARPTPNPDVYSSFRRQSSQRRSTRPANYSDYDEIEEYSQAGSEPSENPLGSVTDRASGRRVPPYRPSVCRRPSTDSDRPPRSQGSGSSGRLSALSAAEEDRVIQENGYHIPVYGEPCQGSMKVEQVDESDSGRVSEVSADRTPDLTPRYPLKPLRTQHLREYPTNHSDHIEDSGDYPSKQSLPEGISEHSFPQEVVEYAGSETSTTRSEYL